MNLNGIYNQLSILWLSTVLLRESLVMHWKVRIQNLALSIHFLSAFLCLIQEGRQFHLLYSILSVGYTCMRLLSLLGQRQSMQCCLDLVSASMCFCIVLVHALFFFPHLISNSMLWYATCAF